MKVNVGLFWVLVAIAVIIPSYVNTLSVRNSAIETCERNNVSVRVPLYRFAVDASKSRQKAAKETTGKERENNLETAENYRNIANSMIETLEEVNIKENSPIIDCEKAHPKPFPL